MNAATKISPALSSLGESLMRINQQAVQAYTPMVEDILNSCSQDKAYIESTLDGLLSFCGYEPALALFRKLCRYYWDLDKEATAYHVTAYREMWDSETEEPL
jgi:hypothetical protein